MRTVPERRPSSSPDEPATGEPTLTSPADAEKLKVVLKRRVGPKEKQFADQVFRGIVVLCAVVVLTIVGLIVFELLRESRLSMTKFGFRFLIKQIWDPVAEDFG